MGYSKISPWLLNSGLASKLFSFRKGIQGQTFMSSREFASFLSSEKLQDKYPQFSEFLVQIPSGFQLEDGLPDLFPRKTPTEK